MSSAYRWWYIDRRKEPTMIAMIFEFTFDPDRPEIHDEYLAASDELRALLSDQAGFDGIERFQSCANPDKYVAVGFFTDEAAVTAWRNTPAHRRIQSLGRNRFFTEYRLRMAEITRDYSATDRTQAPNDSKTALDQGTQHAGDNDVRPRNSHGQ